MPSSSSSKFGLSHAPGKGLKLNFRSLELDLPSGLLPLSGDKASKDETLARSDMFGLTDIEPTQ